MAGVNAALELNNVHIVDEPLTLTAGNTNPQGIADPPASLPLPLGEAGTALSVVDEGLSASSHSALRTPHSALLHDSALLAITYDLESFLSSSKRRR